jgi:hypothetical protein
VAARWVWWKWGLGLGVAGFLFGVGFAVAGAGAADGLVFVAVGAVDGLGGGEHAPVLFAEFRPSGFKVVLQAVEEREHSVVLVEFGAVLVDLLLVGVEVEGGAEVGFGVDGLEGQQTLPCGLKDDGATFDSRHILYTSSVKLR